MKKLGKENKEQLPDWFYADCNISNIEKDTAAFVNLLNSSRRDFYTALSLYQIPVKYSTTLIVSIITVVGVTFSFAQNLISPEICKKVEFFGAFLLG